MGDFSKSFAGVQYFKFGSTPYLLDPFGFRRSKYFLAFKKLRFILQNYCFLGIPDVNSLQHWFDVCNMKRPGPMRISQEEFIFVVKQCDSYPDTICSFSGMKAIFGSLQCDQQPEWLKDILDSDAPKLTLSNSVKCESSLLKMRSHYPIYFSWGEFAVIEHVRLPTWRHVAYFQTR